MIADTVHPTPGQRPKVATTPAPRSEGMPQSGACGRGPQSYGDPSERIGSLPTHSRELPWACSVSRAVGVLNLRPSGARIKGPAVAIPTGFRPSVLQFFSPGLAE